ncbi:MAG: T9SS type A sorting domain-containing protein, partial [bacterium]
SAIQLLQNYPNPFNGATRIRYSLPGSQWVNIRIYDITGREVSVLVNEIQPAGEHETRWDPSNTSSGIYFYRLITPNDIQTKKMILLR